MLLLSNYTVITWLINSYCMLILRVMKPFLEAGSDFRTRRCLCVLLGELQLVIKAKWNRRETEQNSLVWIGYRENAQLSHAVTTDRYSEYERTKTRSRRGEQEIPITGFLTMAEHSATVSFFFHINREFFNQYHVSKRTNSPFFWSGTRNHVIYLFNYLILCYDVYVYTYL